MKKLLLVLTLMFSVAVFSQKEANGKLYIEHPAIEIVNQFNEAYTSGDLDKLKELVTENFQVRTLQDRKSNDINWILGTSNYLSKNITDFQIKHYGGSYPDVLEYKQDGIVDVKTYEYTTYKITYECKVSNIVDKKTNIAVSIFSSNQFSIPELE